MSLETRIEEQNKRLEALNDSIRELIAVMKGGNPPASVEKLPKQAAANDDSVVSKSNADSNDIAVTVADIRTALTRVAKNHGKAEAAAILAKFGARKLPEVKEEDYSKILKLAEEKAA